MNRLGAVLLGVQYVACSPQSGSSIEPTRTPASLMSTTPPCEPVGASRATAPQGTVAAVGRSGVKRGAASWRGGS